MNSPIKSKEKLLKEIASGKYRDCYIIYNRKSTDEVDGQKNSIKIQKTANVKYAFDKKLHIAPITLEGLCADGIISEKHSGFKENDSITFTTGGLVQYSVDRPKFLKLVEFLSKGLFKGIVCLCWDRISRNKGDDTIIRKLMKQGVDIQFVYATYDKSSAGELHMDIDGMFAEHHSRVTSEKVTIATWSLRNKGVCTYRAPIGYLNNGDMYNKPFDPERAPIIKELFELYATEKWSLSDLARYAEKHGLTSAPMRPRRTKTEILAEDDDEILDVGKVSRLISANNIQKILVNKFYTGKIMGNDGVYIQSISHQALVSDDLFDTVQKVLRKKKISMHYTNKIDYLYRGMTRCEICERVYTPYMKKGIQYYGVRCPNGCTNQNKNFNIDFLEDAVGKLISNLSFTEEEKVEIDARLKTDVALFENKRLKEIEQNDKRKKKVREDLTYLRTNKLILLKSGVYSPEDFLAEENKLNNELIAIQDAEQGSDVAMHEVIKDLVKLSELLRYGYGMYSLAKSAEKERLTRIIFSELTLSGNTLKYKCRNGFRALQSRFVPSCAGGETRTLTSFENRF